MLKFIFCITWCLIGVTVNAQTITILDSGLSSSFRGLSVLNNMVFAVSGSNGTVGVSIDGGKHISYQSINGFEDRDFRDIHLFSAAEIIIMAVDNPAIMLKSFDSGHTWRKVYELNKQGMFLDAMVFNGEHGYVVGDPIDNHFVLLKTIDKGNTWLPLNNTPRADSGEACFASSGSNIVFTKNGFSFVSGGTNSGLYTFENSIFKKKNIQLGNGANTSGANSVWFGGGNYKIVGGDFNAIQGDSLSFFYIHKKQVKTAKIFGYKSCIEQINKRKFMVCGWGGVALGNGKNDWQLISNASYNTVQKARNGQAVYLVGKNGKVSRFDN